MPISIRNWPALADQSIFVTLSIDNSSNSHRSPNYLQLPPNWMTLNSQHHKKNQSATMRRNFQQFMIQSFKFPSRRFQQLRFPNRACSSWGEDVPLHHTGKTRSLVLFAEVLHSFEKSEHIWKRNKYTAVYFLSETLVWVYLLQKPQLPTLGVPTFHPNNRCALESLSVCTLVWIRAWRQCQCLTQFGSIGNYRFWGLSWPWRRSSRKWVESSNEE